MTLSEVADENGNKVDVCITEERKAKRREQRPIRLIRRDGTPVEPLGQPETPSHAAADPQLSQPDQTSQPQ